MADRFVAACPILGVGKVDLLLPSLLPGLRWEFVQIGALEVGVLMRLLVGFHGLDRVAKLGSLVPLSTVSFVTISAAALRVDAPFVRVVAKHV